MRAACAVIMGVLVAVCAASAFGAEGATAKGVVFDDANGNGVRDRGEAGIAGVRVSNGREIVLTDEAGRYALPVGDDTVVFVIKPSGWMTPVDELNLPRFYYVHRPAGSPKLEYPGVAPTGPLPESIDFALVQHTEPDRFRIIVFGDTQTRSLDDVNYLEHDILEEVAGFVEATRYLPRAGQHKAMAIPSAYTAPPAFGISLGDVVYDLLDVFEPINEAVAQVGVPFYNVMGNHDTNHDVKDDALSDETWERIYGPAYYSFDYGPVHFLVLDDIAWYWNEEENEGRYNAGLGERQLEFVKNDLALVPEDRLVVVSMHIPIDEIAERKALFALMAEHPHCISFSGHTHIQRHQFIGKGQDWPGDEPHHHLNFGTACGYWWHGEKDEVGIPHTTMSDGTPNCWWTVTFDGTDYSVVFKAARRPADYQMNVYVPDEISLDTLAGEDAADADAADADGAAADDGEGEGEGAVVEKAEVLANVFAGSERSLVEMRVDDGPWTAMKKVPRGDPFMANVGYGGQSCNHMWQADLPKDLEPGTHMVEVRTTDMFGHTYTGRRIFRVK